jgi:hypothetical protein
MPQWIMFQQVFKRKNAQFFPEQITFNGADTR